MRQLYGIFAGTKWNMTTNKHVAMKAARVNHGSVRVMPYPYDTHSWDRTTFHACSEEIANFQL
jgi:hypothetical protein